MGVGESILRLKKHINESYCNLESLQEAWNIETARNVVKNKQYEYVDKITGEIVPEDKVKKGKHVMLDLTSASVLTKVYDAINPQNRKKLTSMPFIQALDIVWKIVKEK